MGGLFIAALMVGTFFLPWFEVLSAEITLYELIRESDASAIIRGAPWQGWVVLASFGLAAFAIVQMVIGRNPAFVMIAAGSAPWVVIAVSLMNSKRILNDMGFPTASGDELARAFEFSQQFFAVGVYIYIASASALLLIGLARLVRGR